jgi:hypothetical protein
MGVQVLINKVKILRIITHVVSKGIEVTVKIDGQNTLFKTKFIKINNGNISSHIEHNAELIIEKLLPAEGNNMIQSAPKVTTEFLVQNRFCRCTVEYQGINFNSPYYGFILSFPESLEIEEKRREERFEFKRPEFISAEFRIESDSKSNKFYELNVLDCSKYGLGMIARKKDFGLLQKIDIGDELKDITLYATWTRIIVNGVVRHKTKLLEGKFKGSYIIGIESPDIIPSCPDQIAEPKESD